MSSTTSVRHVAPAFRTYAGGRALGALTKELDRTGASRTVLVCGASMLKHTDVLAMVEETVGARLVGRYSDTREHSPLPQVQEAAALLAAAEADSVVVLGGGSAVVTARAASILAGEGRDVRELHTHRVGERLVSPRLSAPKIAQWIVPSTPTTAYAKAGAAVRDPETGERLALFDPKARAAGVFLHPRVAETAPAHLVTGAALNALAMSIDGLQSGTDNPLAESSLRHALLLLSEWLPRLGEQVDGETGVRLMLAALLAGQGSDHVGTGLAQPISHALGPHSSVGNGVVEALMLPHVMRFNRGHADVGIAAVGRVLDPAGPANPEATLNALESLLSRIGVPARLQEIGLTETDLDESIGHVMDDWASTSVPRAASSSELRELLHSAW